jgi:hypothetical protein
MLWLVRITPQERMFITFTDLMLECNPIYIDERSDLLQGAYLRLPRPGLADGFDLFEFLYHPL